MNQHIIYKRRPIDIVFQITGIVLLVLLWLFARLAISHSQGSVPSHFKLDGSIDGYAQKEKLWQVPIVGTVLYVGLSLLVYFLPALMRYSPLYSEMPDKSKHRILLALQVFQLLVIAVVTVVALISYLLVINQIQKVPAYAFPIFLAGILLVVVLLVVLVIRSVKK